MGRARGPAAAAIAGARRTLSRAQRWLSGARRDFGVWRRGERNPLIPPYRKGLPSQGPMIGAVLVREMTETCGLGPETRVVDIGCGSGRVAAALTRVLDPARGGAYDGFDIQPDSIAWCQGAITKRHPSFRFQLADLRNAQYNPDGRVPASEYRFPFGDAQFDLALASSLFTHLRPFEGEHYLEEAGRVLRDGGHLFSTWFLINEEAELLLAAGRAPSRGTYQGRSRPPIRLDHTFTDERGNEFRSPHERTPEHLVAVSEELVRAQHERAGLEVVEVRYGPWPGRADGRLGGQDLIVSRRRPRAEREGPPRR